MPETIDWPMHSKPRRPRLLVYLLLAAVILIFIGGRAAIIRAGELTILQKTNQATFTRYYKTAFLTLCDPIEENGQTCLFRYTLLLPSLYSLIP